MLKIKSPFSRHQWDSPSTWISSVAFYAKNDVLYVREIRKNKKDIQRNAFKAISRNNRIHGGHRYFVAVNRKYPFQF